MIVFSLAVIASAISFDHPGATGDVLQVDISGFNAAICIEAQNRAHGFDLKQPQLHRHLI